MMWAEEVWLVLKALQHAEEHFLRIVKHDVGRGGVAGALYHAHFFASYVGSSNIMDYPLLLESLELLALVDVAGAERCWARRHTCRCACRSCSD